MRGNFVPKTIGLEDCMNRFVMFLTVAVCLALSSCAVFVYDSDDSDDRDDDTITIIISHSPTLLGP